MQTITVTELAAILENGEPVTLIDVRTEEEHNAFNIGGVLMPYDEIHKHTDEIPRDGSVVLYCEKGIRSVIAAQKLAALGYTNLINLSGGMSAWRAMNMT